MTPPPVASEALLLDAQPACLAFGAWLKNRICLAGNPARLGGDGLRWSALHGDLGDPGACAALEASAEALLAAAAAEGIEIGVVAHDLHPDFFSSQLAVRIADRLGVPAVPVQHHHAHIAAALAEHGHAGPAIGLALDGVGLGTDGGAWGGELLLVEADDWLRLGALQPLALPGGDIAAREPWRMAAALLHALGLDRQIEFRLAPRVGETAARTVATMLARNLNCPTATGAGRWFDAIAGLLALSDRQAQEAEAAIALETAARLHLETAQARGEAGGAMPGAAPSATPAGALAGFTVADGWLLADDPPHADAPGFTALDLRPFALALLDGLDATGRDDASVGHWAAAFHATLSAGLADWAIAAARAQDVRTVALSGGCFFNRLLRVDLGARLAAAGLEVIDSARAGLGDSGLALGQAWVARQALACRDVLPGDAF